MLFHHMPSDGNKCLTILLNCSLHSLEPERHHPGDYSTKAITCFTTAQYQWNLYTAKHYCPDDGVE